MTSADPVKVVIPQGAATPRRVVRSRVATALGLAAVVEVSLWAVLAGVNGWSPGRLISENELTAAIVAVSFALVGAVVLRRTPGHALGWIFVAEGQLQALSALGAQYATRTPQLPAAGLAAFLGAYVWFPGMLLGAALMTLLFPDGRAASPRWRPLVWTGAGVVAAGTAGVFLTEEPMRDQFPQWHNPLALPAAEPVLEVLVGPLLLAALGCGLAGAVGLAIRMLRTSGVERRRIGWFFTAFLIGLLGQLAADFAPVVPVVAWGFFPVAMGVAMVRHGLFEGDRLLSRTLVYVILTSLVAGVFALFVGLASNVLGGEGTGAVVAAVAIALGLSPARGLVQRGVDRLLYGRSRDPYAALTDLGGQLSAAIASEDVPAIIARTVATSLRLPYVAMTLSGESVPAARYGAQVTDLIDLPLRHTGVEVGHLTIGLRQGQRHLDPADERLLHDFAGHAGAAAEGVRLTHDLRRSRDRLVVAREEERHRIRRDLHDGLGPTLAGVALGLGAARRAVPNAGTSDLLGRLEAEVLGSLDDVRRLVADLYPTTLGQLGLVAALRTYADTVSARSDGMLKIVFAVEDDLPALPSDVEVAAYRIALEALTNVARHAHARRCAIEIRTDERQLHLAIRDDGIGIGSALDHGGIGLRSMAERAAEHAGTCQVRAEPGGGTVVVATLTLEG